MQIWVRRAFLFSRNASDAGIQPVDEHSLFKIEPRNRAQDAPQWVREDPTYKAALQAGLIVEVDPAVPLPQLPFLENVPLECETRSLRDFGGAPGAVARPNRR